MAKVIAPPPGFELDASPPAPPAGFVLESADVPAPPEGFEIQTETRKPANEDAPAWRPAPPPPGLVRRFLTGARESLSPLLGPTENQILAQGVDMPDGTIAYKPMGSRVDQEGFSPRCRIP